MDKIVSNIAVIITTGIFLLVARAMFLLKETILIGTALLAMYITFIVCSHIYIEKPYEVAILFVMGTIFVLYIRNPGLRQADRSD